MRTRPTVGVPSVPWRAQQRRWCGSVVSYDRAAAGSVAASSVIDEISCCSPVTAERADRAAAVTPTDRRSVVVADAGHADRSQLLPTTKAQRPPNHAVRRAYDRPIARRGKARATSLAGVPDVQTVTRGGRMCGSWLLVRADYVPEGLEPYEYGARRTAGSASVYRVQVTA